MIASQPTSKTLTAESPTASPRFRRRALAGMVLSLLAPTAALAGGSLTDLGTLGGNSSGIYALSADGSVVAGWADTASGTRRAFRWTQASGMVDLGSLGGSWSWSIAHALSADGGVVAGRADTVNSARAFRWTQASGMVDLGTLGGPYYSEAYALSADGSVVAGQAETANGTYHAFRWTRATGMVDLGTFGGTNSSAHALSADGSVVAGWADPAFAGNYPHAFRWTRATGMVDLGTFGGPTSEAHALSADGSVVAGWADTASGNRHAFRWTQAAGMVDLGTLGGANSGAYALSADGSVVAGWANTASGTQRAFRWTPTTGMQTVEDWLRANGVSVPNDVTYAAYALSADGNVVAGQLDNGHAFVARVDAVGSGLITLDDLSQSLADTARGLDNTQASARLQIEGAHGRPLLRQVAPGRKTFWVAGDWGRDDHGARNGDTGLAEVGLGHNLGVVQINVALGLTRNRQSLALGGKADTDGRYLLAEALIPVRAGLVATVGSFYHRGKARLKRAYLNAGAVDASHAKPNTRTWGLRARLDWVDLLSWNGTRLTPFADLLHSRGHMDAYTETGGGFPARFDARNEKSTELRLGLDGQRPLGNGLTLLGSLETAHRFQGRSAGSSGTVIGLSSFNLPGATIRKTWLRGGLGVQGKLGQGTGSLMLNATTNGPMPTWWLAANWQTSF